MAKLIEKGEHNHKLTDIIKVLIFTLMLLLPGIVFLPTCLYYSINKYATNTTTTEVVYKYESNQVNTYNDLVEGHIYYISDLYVSGLDIPQDDAVIEVLKFYEVYNLDISLDSATIDEISTYQYDVNKHNMLSIFNLLSMNTGNPACYMIFTNDDCYVTLSVPSTEFKLTDCVFIYHEEIKAHLQHYNYLPQYTNFNVIDHVNENVEDTITHKIAKAYTDTWNEPLFNWTNNTPFNTGLNNFIAIFGITSESKIANTLIYILTITAIYVIFDIIIATFKWVTHIFTSK